MIHTNKTACSYLLALVKKRFSERAFSSQPLMKHPMSEGNDIMRNKKPRVFMATSNQINLTASEQNLKDFLLDVVQMYDNQENSKEKLILRFAGGWVRDKLLGIPSNDIDVAINSLTGSSFTKQVHNYLSNQKNLERHSLNATDIGRCYKTAANPEKSKHLETSTMTIMGYDIDFVNLRKETYSTESRNPIMEFGTPEEDALRRDCTINALFYNIHTDQVEDFTGGLNDLQAGCIKTPVDPKITFLDDPLRILRLIRFANRLNFFIDPACESSIRDPDVISAFHRKITRERVQVEVFKMIKGNNPRGAFMTFDRLGLYHTVFATAGNKDSPTLNIMNWRYAYHCAHELISNSFLSKALIQSESETVWLLAAYAPWSRVKQQAGLSNKSSLALGAEAARLALKVENKKMNLISGCIKNYDEIITLKESILRGDEMVRQRDTVGSLIRNWDSSGGNWRLQVVFAILAEAMDTCKYPISDTAHNQFDENFSAWRKFIDHLEGMKIMDATLIKNITNGKALREALGLKSGKWVGPVLEFCMNWTLRNPNAVDGTEVIEEVKRRRDELGIPPSSPQ
ncbi:CCA tRNA nucleotidyltransferase, mitochondrial [Golovinomyces cichoracearum]|uniref:CCA tRNA nucleotidyltransferase, mitochondrial n=1 Tax=Golovinomyces cichoracearum TaxID=62708 RepID=A0A420J683_9PEZI|nr:CCA tRNA nucleotidyltransferase, mitochondrial [Golovinomyces cichoracearum]